MSSYFKDFPLIQYGKEIAKNILARPRFNDNVKRFYSIFYPYAFKEGERPDSVAYNYYDDVYSDWLIYMSNDMIDPYYDVTLSSENFKKIINKKYSNIRNAQQKIKYYRNNWAIDDTVLEVSTFEALAAGQKKYWKIIEGYSGQIVGYERKETDWIVSTNKIQSFAGIEAGTFSYNERIVDDGDTNNSAFVLYSNTTSVTFQHVIGDWSNTQSFTGEDSGATATVNASATGYSFKTLDQVIPAVEEVYYDPIYEYDYEDEVNQSKKEVLLLDKRYKEEVEDKLREVINE